jgi:hypothetical protein
MKQNHKNPAKNKFANHCSTVVIDQRTATAIPCVCLNPSVGRVLRFSWNDNFNWKQMIILPNKKSTNYHVAVYRIDNMRHSVSLVRSLLSDREIACPLVACFVLRRAFVALFLNNAFCCCTASRSCCDLARVLQCYRTCALSSLHFSRMEPCASLLSLYPVALTLMFRILRDVDRFSFLLRSRRGCC